MLPPKTKTHPCAACPATLRSVVGRARKSKSDQASHIMCTCFAYIQVLCTYSSGVGAAIIVIIIMISGEQYISKESQGCIHHL